MKKGLNSTSRAINQVADSFVKAFAVTVAVAVVVVVVVVVVAKQLSRSDDTIPDVLNDVSYSF